MSFKLLLLKGRKTTTITKTKTKTITTTTTTKTKTLIHKMCSSNNANKKFKVKFDSSAEGIENHFKVNENENLNLNYSFVPIRTQTFFCKDSRGDEANFGAAGGDFGEFLLALDCFIKISSSSVDNLDEIVDEIFGKWLEMNCTEMRPFYLHSDRPALTRLLTELNEIKDTYVNDNDKEHDKEHVNDNTNSNHNNNTGNNNTNSNHNNNTNSNHNQLDHYHHIKQVKDQEKFIELYGKNSEFHGCGHLKLILENSLKYEINSKTLRALLKSFFLRYFKGDPRLLFKVYETVQTGRALIVIHGPEEKERIEDSLLGTQNLNSTGDQVFILNQHAVTNYRKNVLVPFFKSLNSKLDSVDFFRRVEEKGWRNAMYSADALASGKPIYPVDIDIDINYNE